MNEITIPSLVNLKLGDNFSWYYQVFVYDTVTCRYNICWHETSSEEKKFYYLKNLNFIESKKIQSLFLLGPIQFEWCVDFDGCNLTSLGGFKDLSLGFGLFA